MWRKEVEEKKQLGWRMRRRYTRKRHKGGEPVTIKVNKMSDVILPCSLGTNEDIESKLFVWKKGGKKRVFYYDEHDGFGLGRFKGRVSHFPDGLKYGNASIIIRNTKLSDSGNYICDFPRLQPRQKFHIQLVVEPLIFTVKKGRDVVLPCSLSSKENIEFKRFDWKKDGQKKVFLYDVGTHYNNGRAGQAWQFKGRVSHFPDELKYGNASITIRNTKVIDSGNYTCDFPDLQSSQIINIQLVVVVVVVGGECFH
ncbi:immunoglobulin superfamily member 11-like isoform X1 [Micropterus salmoides]|uniref:immunoglobulin superfamily member 11-like isoform X1 n=2 Tax=Micropterus salmoides TaxID=27706 RepID=UPI0018EC0847|nr:immunoglobulin superfamily member 11-like isoform X1 [Micropterus salmoides]